MTRPPLELLRDVATALTCYASTKHAQAHVQKIPSIQAAMLEEVAHIEALEREVREAMRAQAEAGACDTCADVTDNIGQINYCYRCGRRFPEHVAEQITVAEFIARESVNWADVTDPVAWVREMRGDAPDVELGARRNPAHAAIDALMATMGHTDRREAALLTIRREAHYTLKTLGAEGQTPQERLDELCRYLIDVVDAREPLPAQADAADGAGGAGDGGAR